MGGQSPCWTLAWMTAEQMPSSEGLEASAQPSGGPWPAAAAGGLAELESRHRAWL